MSTAWSVVEIASPDLDVPDDCLVQFVGGDPVILASAALARGAVIDGLLLTIDHGYPSALAARDIATMCFFGSLRHVVLDAGELGPDAVELVAALLTNEAVTLANSAGQLTNAYNRPSPEDPPRLWWRDGDVVRRSDDVRELIRRD